MLAGPFEQRGAKLSPDGKWILFMSDDSGNREVYVQRFPDPDGRWMVSSDGGSRVTEGPVWGDDGREIFYERGGTVFAVPVSPGDAFSQGTPEPLFTVRAKSVEGVSLIVTDDGRRILTNELPPADPNKAGARLILNWTAAFAGDR